MNDPLLSVRNAQVGYGKTVIVDGFDLDVNRGEIVALTGVNGAGKSTLLKGLAGYIPMQFSSFELNGVPAAPSSKKHREATFSILDNFSWVRGLSLWDHYKVIKGATSDRIWDALETFEIDDLADRMPYSLSTGQAQRAALATIMLRDWDVLFLDEPEKRLDVGSQVILADVLLEITAERGVVMATHSPDLITGALARVIELDKHES